MREAVPAAVNARVARAKQTIDPRIDKTAADMIVPFDRFEALLDFYDAEFRRRGLDAAVWGHISDGNVHPNVIPRSVADVDSGRPPFWSSGAKPMRLGGAPLAEHGVGRNPVKQELLRTLYGESGIEEMRARQARDRSRVEAFARRAFFAVTRALPDPRLDTPYVSSPRFSSRALPTAVLHAISAEHASR